MADTRYLSFDEALENLSISEDELLNLVSANELRAFRIDREMKFKEADVKAMSTGEAPDAATVYMAPGEGGESGVVDLDDADLVTVDLADEAPAAAPDVSASADAEPAFAFDEGTEEVQLEDSQPIELDDEDLISGAPTEVAGAGAAAGGGEKTEVVMDAAETDGLGTEEIIFEDEDLALGGLEDEDIGTQEVTVREDAVGTEDLTITDDMDMDEGVTVMEESVDDEADEDEEPVGRAPSRRDRRPSMRRDSFRGSRRMGPAGMEGAGQKRGNPFMLALMILMALTMIYPGLRFADEMRYGYAQRDDQVAAGEVPIESDPRFPETAKLHPNVALTPELEATFTTDLLKKWVEMGETAEERPAHWWGTGDHRLSEERAVPVAPVEPAFETGPAEAAPSEAPAEGETPEGGPTESEAPAENVTAEDW